MLHTCGHFGISGNEIPLVSCAFHITHAMAVSQYYQEHCLELRISYLLGYMDPQFNSECYQLLIKSSGGDQIDCPLFWAYAVNVYSTHKWLRRGVPSLRVLYRSYTDHAPSMLAPFQLTNRKSPSCAHSPWTNQSPSHDLWLFWTNPGLTCHSGIHTWMPLGYHQTMWFNQDGSNLTETVSSNTCDYHNALNGSRDVWPPLGPKGTTLCLCLDMVVIR